MINTTITVYNTLRNKVNNLYTQLQLQRYEKTKGRKLSIPVIDAIALALFKQKQNITTKKSLFELLEPACCYKTFVVSINAIAKLAVMMATVLFRFNQQRAHIVKHHDSTDVPVCQLRKSKYHKIMQPLASYSKTGKGWFYGLKLHLTSDLAGNILNARFTSANSSDRQQLKKMNRDLKGIFVADAGYVSQELQKEFSLDDQRLLIIIPRANMKKIATFFELILQRSRMRIELHFRNLKLFFNLITGLPRSVDGYLTNYITSLLAYMLA